MILTVTVRGVEFANDADTLAEIIAVAVANLDPDAAALSGTYVPGRGIVIAEFTTELGALAGQAVTRSLRAMGLTESRIAYTVGGED